VDAAFAIRASAAARSARIWLAHLRDGLLRWPGIVGLERHRDVELVTVHPVRRHDHPS
jgi:hypothetical protein